MVHRRRCRGSSARECQAVVLPHWPPPQRPKIGRAVGWCTENAPGDPPPILSGALTSAKLAAKQFLLDRTRLSGRIHHRHLVLQPGCHALAYPNAARALDVRDKEIVWMTTMSTDHASKKQ